MPRGGKRTGAGRKKNGENKKTNKSNKLAEKASGEGVLPLEVMLRAMRDYHAAGNIDKAVAVAKDAAPYLHPRLNSVKVGGQEGPEIPLGIVFMNSPERSNGGTSPAPSGSSS